MATYTGTHEPVDMFQTSLTSMRYSELNTQSAEGEDWCVSLDENIMQIFGPSVSMVGQIETVMDVAALTW